MTPGERPGLVIFDCDGVLVDSERLTVEVEARMLTELGWPLAVPDVVERFMGGSDASMLAQITERLGSEAAEDFDRRSTEEIVAAFEDRLVAIPGVVDLIDALHDADIPTCVASSGTHRKMNLTLGITGLHDRFKGRIYSATEVDRGKPAPDLFLHAAAAMDVAPESCAVIEDSRHGVAGAVAAGMTCFGFAGGLSEPAQLAEAGAVLFATMDELRSILL
ncbi:MAG: HAD family hydrolase [Actinomycetota bacterium]